MSPRVFVKEARKNDWRGPCCMILKVIVSRRSSFQDVVYIHERRQSNGDAQRLARGTTSLAFGRHVWLVTPQLM
jgi:hypothetical protein